MAQDRTHQWFNRVYNFEHPLHCPHCDAPYAIGPIFDHDVHSCLHCNTLLVEWNMLSVAYLIDLDRAPDIVKALVKYLQPLTEPQAFQELLSLMQFFGVEAIVSLYGETEENT